MQPASQLQKIRNSAAIPSIFAALMASAIASPVRAENLDSAIAAAVDYSPLLTSARSRVDGCAAGVTIARAEGLPTVDASLRYSKELAHSDQLSSGLSANASVNVPLFRGGAVRNGVRASEAQCDASNASVGEVEAEVTLALARTYAEVIANRRIVTLNEEAVINLTAMLDGVRQRRQARDLTRTDVDQAESRLSLARGRLESARASLEASEVEFERLTGGRPQRLDPFPSVFGIPLTADAAVDIAVSENPGIIAARSEAQSTKYSLNSARGDLLPQVFATVNSTYTDSTQTNVLANRNGFGTTVGVGMRMSLFSGGRQGAKVRAASARVTQAEQQILNLERSVSARTRASYAEWQAARVLVETSKQAVAANESALNGVRMENAVGTRTILEILNAEQELRDSQIQEANAEKDFAVASMSILAAMGKARPGSLELENPISSPMKSDGTRTRPKTAKVATPQIEIGQDPQGLQKQELPALKARPTEARPTAARPTEARPAETGPTEARPTEARPAGTRPTGTRGNEAGYDNGRPEGSPLAAPPRNPKKDAGNHSPASNWAVQVGAFESLQSAKANWPRVKASLRKAALQGRSASPAIFRIELNGRSLFRLAAVDLEDWSQAEATCLAMKEAGLGCLVKRTTQLGEIVWSAHSDEVN